MRILIIFSCLVVLTACSKSPVVKPTVINNNNDTTAAAPSYRPLFHYTANMNWINDPNGLLYYNGGYQLFSQYNPNGYVWGNMSWHHALSTDLFNWQDSGTVINEIFNADGSTSMIFSGSAVVDTLNTSGFATQAGQIPLVAVYTLNNTGAGGNAISQTQGISYSLDGGNTWTPYSKNPILDIGSTQFRDPKVFWYAPGKKWIMVVSKPDQDNR